MKYKCLNCGKTFAFKDAALLCCNDPETIFSFKCSECRDVYSSEYDATYCCEQYKIKEIEE